MGDAVHPLVRRGPHRPAGGSLQPRSKLRAAPRQPMTVAATVATALLAVIAVFQLALALGAPLGKGAWGGRNEGVLPVRLRIASGLAAVVIYPLIALFVLAVADLVDLAWLPIGEKGMWVLTGFFALGTMANLASRSTIERIWAPVSLTIALCCAFVALAM